MSGTRDRSPNVRQQQRSPIRSPRSHVIDPKSFTKKMSADEQGLNMQMRYDLMLPDRTVDKIMGPDPIPAIDIEYDEIQNELQRKLTEEIRCVMCGLFPYMPLECRQCHKIFCQYCQLQLQKNPKILQDEVAIEAMMEETGEKLEGSPNARRAQTMRWLARNRGQQMGNQFNRQATNEMMQCPNCKCKGDCLTEVNPIVRNCVDFCEFPHKCNKLQDGEVLWKSVGELQSHAFNDECPKYGCDICYLPEYQSMTRSQLREHIKRYCPEVMVQCQVCSKEYSRNEFPNHKCLKDYYIQKLKQNHIEVVEYMAEKMMKYKRQKKILGLCSKSSCLTRYRESGGQQFETMVQARQNINPVKCGKCTTVTQGQEEAYFCTICNENYCGSCLGYNLQYDLQELEDILNGIGLENLEI